MTIRVETLRLRRTAIRVELSRYLPGVILAGYGVFILSLFVRDDLTMYINPAYVWPSTAAGIVLLGLATTKLVRGKSSSSIDACCSPAPGESCCCEDSCGCDAKHTRVWPYVFLSVPLLLAAIFPPQSLAAFSARQRGVQVAGMSPVRGLTGVKRVSLSVNTRTFTLQDWVGALSSDPNPADYLHKPIILTGIVIHDPASAPPGYFMVLRYQVTCCIADARPVGLIVKDTSHGSLQDNQWVTVTGTMGKTSYQGQQVAVVEPESIVPTRAGNPYMY